MKVIDLLNKIANGEEVPIFEYEGCRYKYNKKWLWFDNIDDNTRCKNEFYCCELNDEVEIIEDTPKEDKKIEKLDLQYNDTIKGLKFEEQILMYCDNLQYKINEIIEVINERNI